jgi:Na+/H+ antiporter NhaD/arsenite permease-like protein
MTEPEKCGWGHVCIKHLPWIIKRKRTTFDFAFFTMFCIVIALFFSLVGFNIAQNVATTVFAATVLGTLMFWRFRLAIAIFGIAILLFTQTLNLETTLHFMSLDVIIFLVSMMIIVEELEGIGFFRWLMIKMIRLTGFGSQKLMVMFIALSMFAAACVDEVTSILFIATMVLDLCDYLDLDPVPYVIAAVLATNIGSAATILGNPVGILVALRAGITFEEYLRWATPISLICVLSLMPICLLYFRGALKQFDEKVNDKLKKHEIVLDESSVIKDGRRFKQVVILFLFVIILIVLHHRIESALGMQKSTILLAGPLIGAGGVLLMERQRAKEIVDTGVDWWTLLFFMFLFAKAGALQYTGVTTKFADVIVGVTNGNFSLILTIMIWASGLLSGTIDNVPIIAALIPVVYSLNDMGVNVYPLWWALVLGGCLGGNLTMVGSTANIVALGILEKRKNYFMNFLKWFKIGVISVLVTIGLAWLLIFIQLPLMP